MKVIDKCNVKSLSWRMRLLAVSQSPLAAGFCTNNISISFECCSGACKTFCSMYLQTFLQVLLVEFSLPLQWEQRICKDDICVWIASLSPLDPVYLRDHNYAESHVHRSETLSEILTRKIAGEMFTTMLGQMRHKLILSEKKNVCTSMLEVSVIILSVRKQYSRRVNSLTAVTFCLLYWKNPYLE